MQHLGFGEHGRLRAAVFGQIVVGENHVLQHEPRFLADGERLAGLVQLAHAAHDVPQQLTLARIVDRHAARVGTDLGDLAQIVQNHACGQQIAVQLRIDAAHRVGHAQHGARVVQQAAALGVMQARRRGIVHQRFAALIEPVGHKPFKLLVPHPLHAAPNHREHILRRIGRAGQKQAHVHAVLFGHGAQFVDAQLRAAVVLLHHGADLDHRAGGGRLNGAVPHLGVELAGHVAQRHIEELAAVGGRALLGRLHQHIALKHLIFNDLRKLKLHIVILSGRG